MTVTKSIKDAYLHSHSAPYSLQLLYLIFLKHIQKYVKRKYEAEQFKDFSNMELEFTLFAQLYLEGKSNRTLHEIVKLNEIIPQFINLTQKLPETKFKDFCLTERCLNFVRLLYLNAFSCLSIRDQFGYESAHQEKSRCTYECFGAGTSCS